MPARQPLFRRFPEFPWDTLADVTSVASSHPDGIVNLSIGTPVDEVAPSIQLALAENAAEPGYPQVIGSVELRQSMVAALERRYGITGLGLGNVQQVVGTKEAIGLLPTMLGIGEGHTVVIPEVAYPTYEVAALTSGAKAVRADSLLQLGPSRPSMLFLNTPSNPTGKVLGVEHLRKVVEWARQREVIVASDECYIGLGWDDEKQPVSILDPRVCDGDFTNLLAIHSLSKSSNLASYRFGFFAGDAALIHELAEARKHLGFMVPGPIQAAAITALNDDSQEEIQKLRYAVRRAKLVRALLEAGFDIENSEAGLYLWATRGEDCRDTLQWLAERGILVAPGEFYGPKGQKFVRIALTAADELIDAACQRLADQNLG